MKSKNFLRGALILSFGGVVCKVLGAIYRVPLANILGEVGMGVYQLVYPIYAFAIVFVNGGITSSLSFLVAKNKDKLDYASLKKFFWASLILSTAYSIVVGLGLVIFSSRIANLLGNFSAGKGLLFSGISILFCGIISSVRGWFQGFENMTPTAISQVVEQLFKVGIGIWLAVILLKYGVEWAVAGAFLGVLAGEIVASLYLVIYSLFKGGKENVGEQRLGFKSAFRQVGSGWIGFGLTGLIVPFTTMLESFMVVNLLKNSGINQDMATALFGIQSGMIGSLINFPMIFAIALSSAIIPSIGYLLSSDRNEATNKINLTLKLVVCLTLPCVVGMMVISPNIISLFYPTLKADMASVAVVLLLVSAINILYLGLLQITSAILQAMGKIWLVVLSSLLGSLLKIGIILLLVPNQNINILGAAIAGIVGYFVPCVINLFIIRKHVNVGIGVKNTFVVLGASLIMAVLVLSLKAALSNIAGNLVVTIMCVLTAVISYFVILYLLGVVTKKDIKTMFKSRV